MNEKIGKSIDWVTTAKTLSEALPYLKRYESATIVIKLGGAAMANADSLSAFARDIVLMKQCKVNPIIVHGGGPMINDALDKWKIDFDFIEGKRVTDDKAIKVVEMVLSGDVNRTIVSSINCQGGKGIGLSGKDASLLICEKENPRLGFVGKPIKTNIGILSNLVENDFIPVIAPIGTDESGQTFNINADTMAGVISASMSADRLLLLTDVKGVQDSRGKVVKEAGPKEIQTLLARKTISGGMIPKVKTALDAIEAGVRAVVILDGRVQNACLLELFTDHGVGTLIRNQCPRI
ncbi:MAG: acetylglutamate kinase [Pseudomonadota bacterium]|nr:acetylglutamate kinase [Pseudomonadota bacterium]